MLARVLEKHGIELEEKRGFRWRKKWLWVGGILALGLHKMALGHGFGAEV